MNHNPNTNYSSVLAECEVPVLTNLKPTSHFLDKLPIPHRAFPHSVLIWIGQFFLTFK
jgi:hypothetical protein